MTTALTSKPFGRALYCVDRVVPGRMVSGATLVGQAAVRRLTTTRGQLAYDQNYGLNLVQLLNRRMTKAEQAAIPGRIRNELRKDERIERLTVDVAKDDERTWAISIYAETSAGPFRLALSVDDVSVEVLGLQEAA